MKRTANEAAPDLVGPPVAKNGGGTIPIPKSSTAADRRGRAFTESEVAAILQEAGFTGAAIPKMVCTAKYESGFFERAWHINRNGSIDRGLFQINGMHVGKTRDCPATTDGLYDAMANARCAHTIYAIFGPRAWSAYRRHVGECTRYRVSG